ncbi:transporter substrate-binding domain-containing protein [Streptomyces sp. 8K308]|uniref:serine/threonine-protein kinase n=1 Tax=Streptomyces sp. 8K308 TaxID=2530388 RepID=UPI00104BC7E7|nr:serine/threonine-protein kinase [Streptomyces sp. 8K308]TDC22464.1 transporter substrate-binding domain-containing protein [Streptomyces sp. 8K308]
MEALHPNDPSAIGPYGLLARLGEGGMGRVFLGRSPGGRTVAVKVVHSDLARQPLFRRRFRAEIEAARRVSEQWTAPVLDHDIEAEAPWVATGYVAGESLREVVDTLHGPLPEHAVWALAHGLANALLAVHDSGLIHRDLKPSNVMVTLEGPKVIDFGIARAVDTTALTQTGRRLGSPGYMPPEQIRGEELTGAVDVFALGVVLAYAATGMSPFSWDDAEEHTVMYRVLNEAPNLGPEGGPLTGDLRTIVLHCLAKDPAQRLPLSGLPAFARKRAGSRYWLPAELAALLGRASARVHDFETPRADRDGWGPQPPSAWDPLPSAVSRSAPPAGGGAQTTVVPTGFEVSSAASFPVLAPPPPTAPPTPPMAQPVPGRPRRGRLVSAVVSGAVALALVGWLVQANLGDDGGEEPAAGGDEPMWAGGITVHANDAHDPVLFTEGGELVGFEVDLVEELGERLGVPVTFEAADGRTAAAEAAVREGRGDTAHIAVGDLADNEEQRQTLGVDFVNDYEDGWSVVTPDPEQSGDLDDLCGLRVIAYPDGQEAESVREHTEECETPAEILSAPTKDDMVEAIVAGEADVAVMGYTQAAYHLAVENPDTGLNVVFDASSRGARGIAVPAGQVELRQALFEAMGELMRDGTYARLLSDWDMVEAALDAPEVNLGS